MRFNPDLISAVIALNLETPFADIELIKTFYTGEIIPLVGFWGNEQELSYQLNMEHINHSKMPQALLDHKQESLLFINEGRKAFLVSLEIGSKLEYVGLMTEVAEEAPHCTYCPESKTYWKAIL